MKETPPTTIAVTGGADERDQLLAELARGRVSCRPGRFSPRALIVKSGNIYATAAFREGRVAAQSEASQLVALLVAPRPGEAVLDLCAAPGMKTVLVARAMSPGLLVACDVSGHRLRTMRKLLLSVRDASCGARPSLVRLDATRDLPFTALFDRVLVDAPCSGTGTVARDPEIKWRLKPVDLARFAETQKRILQNALKVLKPGGRLVYATCSLEPEENEGVVDSVLAGLRQYRIATQKELVGEFPALDQLFDARGFFRTRPDLHGMDGFFAAVLAG